MEARPFSRLYTGLKINQLLKQIPEGRTGYITEMYPKWKDTYSRLKEYGEKHTSQIRINTTAHDIILQEGDLSGAWDGNIYGDYKEMETITKMFYFLPLVQEDRYYDTESLKNDRRKLVASLLVYQKKNLDSYVLVPVPPVEVEEQAAEQLYAEHLYIDEQGELEEA